MEETNIGGADHNNSLAITHVIGYKTPYQVQGNAVNIVIGLSENTAATALLLISFLVEIKSLFSLQYQAPSRQPALTGGALLDNLNSIISRPILNAGIGQ